MLSKFTNMGFPWSSIYRNNSSYCKICYRTYTSSNCKYKHYSIIHNKNINIKIKKFTEITQRIKEKTEELKEKAANREKISSVIDDLKQKQLDLLEKLEKQTSRLRDALPNIATVKKVNQFLKQKVELKKKSKTEK